ncbi:unnamed protein product [Diamesa tonsa]
MTVDFNDYFWGDKNNGYEVLYQNMKYGLSASKELSEYFRERSSLDDHNSKLLQKLANKAGSGGANGTFSPLWIILKTSAERLAELHSQMMTKTTELLKNIIKYADELHKKHKTVKEEESSTQDAVHQMKESTIAVQKAKDLYTTRQQEVERLRKDNASAKDIEKAETKLKKLQEEYRLLVEKHNPIKQEFERKMTLTCKRFQDVEEAHLTQMKDFINLYIDIVQNNHDLVGQVHTDFKRQFLDLTVDKLLEQFVLNKYTGLEKPEIVELDLNLSSNNLLDSSVTTNHDLNAIASFTLNNTSSSSYDSPSILSAASSSHQTSIVAPVATVVKKESSLLSWFTQSSSTSTSSAVNSGGNVSVTSSSSSAMAMSPPTVARSHNLMDGSPTIANGQDSTTTSTASPPSMKISNRVNYGELFVRQFNKNGNKLTAASSAAPTPEPSLQSPEATPPPLPAHVATTSKEQKEPQQQQQQQQKSSRRTTSLLNLFMSNSQGSRESRDNPSEVLSAPTSPVEQTHLKMLSNSSNIGVRNPLRGSKFSGFLRSRRDKASKKKNKKKDKGDTNSNKDDKSSDIITSTTPTLTNSSMGNSAPTATPEVDEDGYSIQPSKDSWDKEGSVPKNTFYSSSDSESEDERERKIHVEIKPINVNGSGPISASVDELRATIENLSLSPIGVLSNINLKGRRNSQSESDSNMKRSQSVSQQIGDKPGNDMMGLNTVFQQHQSPIPSNASTPTTAHPYAPLQSPTLSVNNNRYADLGDIFSEVGDMSSPTSAALAKINRQIPTPTSGGSSIAIPRPPSRRSEQIRGRISPATMARADSVGSLEFRTAGVGVGLGSRGPSPLTIGMSDTIPLAIAFHEIIHAFFKGSDESRCQVKMSGDMMLSFPAGIVNVLANNPNPAKLCFRIKNVQNLDNILPNKQLINVDKLQSTNMSTTLEFNMPALTLLLRRQSEQNPTASYFNVDILKYTVRSKTGAQSCPFQLVSYWKCEPTHTDIKIDYKYNSHSMAQASPLLNVSISVPVDGGVRNVQSKPHSAWLGESNKLMWNFTDISQHSDNGGIDTLRARLEIANGPSTPSMITTQFNCEGTTLSGIDFDLAGSGYRISLVKRRFVAGKYICEGDGIRSIATPTPPIAVSPNPYTRTG